MNSHRDDDIQTMNTASASLGGFFIPGITARARCLSSRNIALSTSINEDELLDDSSGLLDDSSGLQDDSSGRSSSYAPTRRGLRRGNRKDIRFSKMMEELTADRKAADEARLKAVRVKKHYENEGSKNHSRHHDAVFQELSKYGAN